jgi:hypothetical protein
MGGKTTGLITGAATGMFLGFLLFMLGGIALQKWGGVRFGKELWLIVPTLGFPAVGGVIGAWVGRWANTTSHTR